MTAERDRVGSPAIGGETLESLLDRFASGSPTPGGGAAAALAGAAGAALVGMVARVRLRRSGPDSRLTRLVGTSDQIRGRLTALIAEDSDAYRQVLEARGVEEAGQDQALHGALVRATRVPLEVAQRSAETLGLCASLADEAPVSTLGDLGVAAALAWAALEAGSLTARTNLPDLPDAEFVCAATAELDRLAAEGTELRGRIAKAIARRA